MKDFRNVKVWEKAHQLTLRVEHAIIEIKRMLTAFLKTIQST